MYRWGRPELPLDPLVLHLRCTAFRVATLDMLHLSPSGRSTVQTCGLAVVLYPAVQVIDVLELEIQPSRIRRLPLVSLVRWGNKGYLEDRSINTPTQRLIKLSHELKTVFIF